MWRRPMAAMRGEAAGDREPMTTQQISTAQRTRSRVRLSGSRSMLSFTGTHFLFRLAEPALRCREAELEVDGSFDGADVVERQRCHSGFEPLLADGGDLVGHYLSGLAIQVDRGFTRVNARVF